MGGVQEQRYLCKICSKSCVSGKSLGGHMRVHLALISANKKAAAAKAKFVSKMCVDDDDVDGDDDDRDCGDHSNSTRLKMIKKCSTKSGFEGGDPNSSYELRENPKKSYRFSNSKDGILEIGVVSCKECGKGFSTLRSLSGHMRCHSIKNVKEVHQCKECGKGFDSVRAMFGHMKTHSKKCKVSNAPADVISGFENLCPVRKKRSSIRYRVTPNVSVSSLNESSSADSELRELKLAAKCLIMISKGVTHCVGFNSVIESDDDDSLYFGAESSRKKKRICGNGDGDLSCDGDKRLEVKLSSGNVFEFDGLDSKSAAEDTKMADLEICDDLLSKVDYGMKGGVEVADPGIVQLDQLECLDYQMKLGSADTSTESTESLMEEAMGMNHENEAVGDLFDLNFPASVEGMTLNVGSNRWWAGLSVAASMSYLC